MNTDEATERFDRGIGPCMACATTLPLKQAAPRPCSWETDEVARIAGDLVAYSEVFSVDSAIRVARAIMVARTVRAL